MYEEISRTHITRLLLNLLRDRAERDGSVLFNDVRSVWLVCLIQFVLKEISVMLSTLTHEKGICCPILKNICVIHKVNNKEFIYIYICVLHYIYIGQKVCQSRRSPHKIAKNNKRNERKQCYLFQDLFSHFLLASLSDAGVERETADTGSLQPVKVYSYKLKA